MVKIHERKEENKNRLTFSGMGEFYGKILGKIKEKRDQNLAKNQPQDEEETTTLDWLEMSSLL